MRPDKAASHAATHTAVVGNFQNQHKQARFKAYQATPKKLKTSANRIAHTGPQKIRPVTALYLWCMITPHLLTVSSAKAGKSGNSGLADIGRTDAVRRYKQAPELMHAELTRHQWSPQLRRSELPPLPRKITPVRIGEDAIEIAGDNSSKEIPARLPLATEAPMPGLLTVSSTKAGKTSISVVADIDRTDAARWYRHAPAPKPIHAQLTRQRRSPQLRRAELQPLSRRIIPVRTDEKAIEIARENSGNEMTTRPPVTTRSPMPQSLSREAKELRALTDKANREVVALLIRQGFTLTKHATDWLPTLIETAVNFADKDAKSHAVLARYLQKASGRYGAYAGEVMSFALQKKIIRNWIVFNLLGQPIEDLIETKIQKTAPETHLKSIDLYRYLLQATFDHWNLNEQLKTWIYRNVLTEEVPMMAYLESTSDIADSDRQYMANLTLDSFEWGNIHAGLRLLHSTGLEIYIPPSEAGELGRILLVQLQESVAPASWWAFFRLPAIIRYTQDYPDLLRNNAGAIEPDIDAQALISYLLSLESMTARNFPLEHLYRLLRQYHSRPELAHRILHEQCTGTPLSRYPDSPGHVCFREVKSLLQPPEGRSNKPILEQVYDLPNIDQKFQEQNDAIANAYQVVDRTLLTAACNTLPTDDLDYLNQAEVRCVKVRRVIADSSDTSAPDDTAQSDHAGLIDLPRKYIEFFSAQCTGSTERIYALEKKNTGYQLKRVDQVPENYVDYFPEATTSAEYALRIIRQDTRLKSSEQDLNTLLEYISETHRRDLARNLHDYGQRQTNWELAENVVLSLIPFYNCATSAAAGGISAAILPCSLDAISLLPLAGQFASLSLRLGEILGTSSLMAMRNAAIDVNLSNMLQATLRSSQSDWVRYAVLPATEVINRDTAATLGMATLRSLDPGIELIASTGAVPLRQTIRLAQAMAPSWSRLENLLDHVETTLPNAAIPRSHYVLARRTGIDKEIPVIRLAGDRYRDRPVYVQVNPVSGQAFGRKYVLLADNMLEPIPQETAHHLQNILTQGLGGKGAVEQAHHWAVNTGELDAAMLRRLQHGVENGANLNALSTHYGINAQSLPAYMSASGKLTARGERMLAQAEEQRAHSSRDPEHMRAPAQAIDSDSGSPPAPPASSSIRRVGTWPISADADVRRSFIAHDGMITSHSGIAYLYDIDLDVFVERRFGQSEFAYIADPENQGLKALSIASARQRLNEISNDQRSAVLKAIDIDLDIAAILNRELLIPLPKQAIPKRISYIWIGNQIFKDDLIAILETNCIRANQNGFKVYFYLSEQSHALNYVNIRSALCRGESCIPSLLAKNEVKILETTEFYQRFSASNNYQQYRDAIDGNGGIATNFASAADILRLAILQDKGGLYMDVDDTLNESFGKIVLKASTNGLVLSELLESEMLDMHPEFGTSFFGCHPGNTVIDDMLQEIARRYQLVENRDFYKIARPRPNDRGAMLTYMRKLSALTGPKVFNQVLREKFPDVKEFMEMSKLETLSYRPLTSELIQKLLKKTPTAEDIKPLAGCSEIGSLHSWREHRKKRG